MLRTVIAFALSKRALIMLGLLVFFIAGIFAYSRLNIEAYPNPAPVILEITAQAPGLSAEEMERYYTRPMEVGLATTPGIDNIRSTSFYGLSFIRVTFKYGIDYYFAYTQAALNLQQNVNLPGGIQPQIQASSLVGEIYRYQLVGPPHTSLTALRTLQDWVVTRRLLTVHGVAQVVTWGGTTKEYEVIADQHKMEALGITIPQLVAAVGNGNVNVGGRTLQMGQQSVNIRGIGLIRDTDDLGNVVLRQDHGAPVKVSDIATVKVGFVPRLGKAGRDAQSDVVTGIVVMNRTQQTKDVIQRVQQEVAKINSDGTLPPGVKIVPFYDRTSLIQVTTHTVIHNLLFGVLLVFLIQWMFLGDLRSALIVSANIPFALFFSIMILVAVGDSANLLSLGAVDLGIIVESAVILIENIFRNLQKDQHGQAALLDTLAFADREGGQIRGKALNPWSQRLRLIYLSALQVDRAVWFSSCITVAAFLPLFTMQGVEGQIFGPMARTYAYALTGALIATFTVSPVLASMILPEHMQETETWLVRGIRRIYRPALNAVLKYRKTTVWMGCLFFLGSLLLLKQIGSEFLPALEEGNLWIRATMPTTISLEAGMDKVDRMRAIIKSHPEVITVVSQHGRPDDGSDASGFYNAEFFVPLKPFDTWRSGYTKDQLVQDLQKQLSDEFPGIGFNFSQYIQDNVEEGLSGVKGANSVKIMGPDLVELEKLAGQVMQVMSHVQGVQDLGIFHVLGQPNLDITVDRARAARYGLNAGDINGLIQTALGGSQATTVFEDDKQFGVVVRLAKRYRAHIDDIRHVDVGYTAANGTTAYIPLSEVATITLDTGASYIYHESNERFIPVKFSVRGRDLGSTVIDAQARVKSQVILPSGYHLEWAGEYGEMKEAQHRLYLILPVAFCLILLLLYTLFGNVRDSLLTLAAIPFSVGGGIGALYISGLNLSVSAAIGFVSLLGVSVMMGILIITYFNQMISEGLPPVEAMREAGDRLMRPTLMTALSACIALLPAAMSHGIGSQVQRPLATVVVGGMLVGPIMLLLVAPALQVMVREGFKRRRSDAAGEEAPS